MEFSVKIKNISKSFGDVKALDDVNINIRNNSMFGFVGPDGAGKTTLIRILCGLIKQDSGQVELLEKDINQHPDVVKHKIGYLSQKFSLYTDLTVDENIEFISKIHGAGDYHNRRDELLQFTRLTKFRKFLAGQLSGGMKQKLALACALIFKPEILLLDEPTTGVDPVSRREFWLILSDLIKEKLTIIVSTPYMDEAERFNKIALINEGRVLAKGTPEEIKSLMEKTILEIVCNPVRIAYKLLKENMLDEIQIFGDRIHIAAETGFKREEDFLRILKDNSVKVTDYGYITPSLENTFIHLLRK